MGTPTQHPTLRLTGIFLVLILLLIVGCGNKEKSSEPTGEVVKDFKCSIPYIQVGSECCLDENGNSICDKDETTTTPIQEEKSKEDSKDYQPVQALAVESCASTSLYDCPWSYTSKEEVQFKLKATKAGVMVVKKVEIPNIPCTKEFENTELEDGLKFGEIKQFNIKCDLKKDVVDSVLDIYVTFYEKDGFKDKNVSNTWKNTYNPQEVILNGWISGIVR